MKWKHVDALPAYALFDVAAAPGSPGTVIAVGPVDHRVASVPIWRSSDGGATWAQPSGSVPTAGPRCTDRASAYSVSFEPGSDNVFVATDCGLAVSANLGATWTHVQLDPTAAVNPDRNQNAAWSVLAQQGGRVNVAAADGLWFRASAAGAWTRATTGPASGQQFIHHAFAASPYRADHLFHAGGGQQVFTTVDGGANWAAVGNGVWNRGVFIRATRASAGGDQVVAWFGEGANLSRRTFTDSASALTGAGAWTAVTVDHNAADPSVVAFGAGGGPILLAADGGVHRTTDGGGTWTLSGGGAGGLNALQITEVTGQSVTGASPHLDLYFGTQDNNNHASSDGGATWPNQMCCEGFYLRTGATSVDHTGAKVTGVTCGACVNYVTDAHFAGWAGWNNAPDGDSIAGDVEGNPFLLKPGSYIQNTINNDVTPAVNAFQLTPDTGTTWSAAFTIPQDLRGVPAVAGPASSPTIYQAVRRAGLTSDGQQRIGLVKVTNVYGTASVSAADGTGFGSLGIFPTMFAWYVVYGVDPGNPDRLLIADIETDEMKHSWDGGATWHADAALTALVTDGGTMRFKADAFWTRQQFPNVHAIAFDPYNACHVLVGTSQSGILRSADGGATWARVSDSRQITNLSSFHFPPTGPVLVSSYGRGLWKLNVKRDLRCLPRIDKPRAPIIAVPTIIDPATGARVQFKDLGDPEVCPACQYVIVRNGRITDAMVEGGRVKRIFLSGGSVHQVDAKKRELPLAVENDYAVERGRHARDKVLRELLRDQVPVRALVLDGEVLKGIVVSGAELPFVPARAPYLRVVTKDMQGGVPRTEAGGTITVEGEGFAPDPAQNPVRILVGGEEQKGPVAVDAQGRFRVELTVRRMPGEYDVTVEQVEGKRRTREASRIKVVTRDDRQKR